MKTTHDIRKVFPELVARIERLADELAEELAYRLYDEFGEFTKREDPESLSYVQLCGKTHNETLLALSREARAIAKMLA